MALTILAALILASAAYHFLGLRRHTLGRQIIFWLIFLAVSTAIVGKNGWTRPLVILFFINIGVAICSLCISGYAHRSIRHFGAMSPEQREQAMSKMPPFVRDRIVRDLKNDAAS